MISFYSFAINNLKRSPVRCILTALSIMVSAATLIIVLSLDKGYMGAVQSELVDKTGVHLYITKEGCPIEAASVIAQGGLSPLYVEENLVERVQNIQGVQTVLPFKLFAFTTDDGTRTDIFMGVTEAVQQMKPDWHYEKGGYFINDSSVVLGWEMARIEKLEIGDRTYFETFDREFIVSGILKQNYSQDDGTFFLPLNVAQKLVGREQKLSAIAIKLDDINALDAVRVTLRGALPQDYFVIGSKELSDGILGFFGSTRVIMFVMVIVAFVISVFGIINTMLMSVLERKKEIAYLKCVGASKADILRIISLETLFICTAGSIAGVATGAILSPFFGRFMRRFLIAYVPSGQIAGPEPLIILLTVSVCIVTGVVCAIYPAVRAAGIVPMEVLRNE